MRRNQVAVVGAAETTELGVIPNMSQIQLHADAALNAIADAGFIETEELKDPLAIEVEDPQIISLVQIAFDRLKMPAIALLGERQWNLKRDELADAFLLEHLKKLLIA